MLKAQDYDMLMQLVSFVSVNLLPTWKILSKKLQHDYYDGYN